MAKSDRRISGSDNLTIAKVDKLKSSFELDLIAFFNVMQETIMERLDEGISEGKTPDQVISDIQDELR